MGRAGREEGKISQELGGRGIKVVKMEIGEEEREKMVALLRGAINELSKGELGEEDAIKAMCIATQMLCKALDLIDPIVIYEDEEEEL